jgi:hypothetical protein
MERREFLKLAGIGGVVFASGLGGWVSMGASGRIRQQIRQMTGQDDFYFVQMSDTHIGFEKPKINPDFAGTLEKAVAQVNSLPHPPDFIVFTGDLTDITPDAGLRRERMTQFRQIISGLKVKNIHFMPGEHDASLDRGAVFQQFFGPTHYTFDHKGVHFIVLDNVSQPDSSIGAAQLAWLKNDLAHQERAAPIVVLTHRPLFDLYPKWDWFTRDGRQAVDLLMPFHNVTVFYGHIHQENHFMTGHIAHHSAHSLMFPLPLPGSQPQRTPVPWDAHHPYKGLGFRSLEAKGAAPQYALTEWPIRV